MQAWRMAVFQVSSPPQPTSSQVALGRKIFKDGTKGVGLFHSSFSNPIQLQKLEAPRIKKEYRGTSPAFRHTRGTGQGEAEQTHHPPPEFPSPPTTSLGMRDTMTICSASITFGVQEKIACMTTLTQVYRTRSTVFQPRFSRVSPRPQRAFSM